MDQHDPEVDQFEQRIALWHKGFDRPTVLQTTGYGGAGAFTAEPTSLVNGNQPNVGERFFGQSSPAAKDWTKLDIWPAATDHHRIVQAFKALYGGATHTGTPVPAGNHDAEISGLPAAPRAEATKILRAWVSAP